ncbi:TIGR01777 family protein [Cohnella sp. CFH 77786]|uniref:TIGR01777 family oxidoreductase n=1 Tax=Cohnella sp. CFH 77786 TaxID=2662265 RepID=UPI001C60ECEF|nr:TIGR01777 family oxidoreductase [Cohnella sp. CFH 77786]MBW5447076.1 TIGR01777 family protein [Cohnella sp. CFH 77786]
MRLLLCGGTGLIGSALADELLARGDEVWIVTRKKPAVPASAGNRPSLRYATWEEWAADPARWDGFDAVVNLAGETISQRWTKAAKKRIVGSRVQAAERVADILNRMSSPPPVVVNASGISLYGHSVGSGSPVFDESSPARPADFLGDTIMQWEAAADRIPAQRLVKLRTGMVLAREGGAFPLLWLPYRLFAGGRMGNGRQGMPWIHLKDMVGLILLSLDNPDVYGPLNAVAPNPVTNDEFGRTLGKVLRRPHWFPVPGALLRTVLGEMSTLVLTGQQAMPRKALEHGYRFVYPELENALRDITR